MKYGGKLNEYKVPGSPAGIGHSDLIPVLINLSTLWLHHVISILKYIPWVNVNYPKTSNICCTLSGNKIVDNSDVVGASPVGAAPTTSSFST